MAINVSSGPDPFRLDRGESVYFARQAEYIKSQTYDTKPAELKAFLYLPIVSTAGPGARTITFRRFTKVGFAKIISDYARDFPRTDIYGVEETVKIYSIGASFGYNIMEIRTGAMTGQNLETRKAIANRQAHEEEINEIALKGDAEHNIQGLLHYPGITETTLPADGVGGSTRFKDKSVDQILRDINILTDAIMIPTNGREVPDTLLLPMSVYNHLTNKRLGDNAITLMKYIMDNNPTIKRIDWLTELAGAGEGKTDRVILGKFDEPHITLEIPQPYEQFDPMQQGMEYTIPCHSRTAGVLVYYPMAFCFADGI